MWHMLWPILLVVLSNTFYNICQKSTPAGANPFMSLLVTYLVAGSITAAALIGTIGLGSIPTEMHKLNWTSFVLGLAIVGLEVGYIFLYRAGWKVSVGSVTSNIALAVVLVFVGMLFYKEHIGLKQIIGMLLCFGGLALITL